MLTLVLISHFIYGAIATLVYNRLDEAVTEYQIHKRWLNSGYVHHQDYIETRKRLWIYVAVAVGYTTGLALIIICSFKVLLW